MFAFGNASGTLRGPSGDGDLPLPRVTQATLSLLLHMVSQQDEI